ncbi:MAG: PaREP1 family protein [Thaumarchaeota archaeon]|jgi:hypothetical protein|nr:PaREP1 family protein [Nitrososphaerota archaeon]
MSREIRSFDEARRHLELAERFLAEGRELIDKDPVQASERLYKAAEEAVKIIAIALKLPEADEAARRSRWTIGLLEDAVMNIMRILKVDELYRWWDSAYKLHVNGFHEARLRSYDVRLRLGDVKASVNLAKKMLKA